MRRAGVLCLLLFFVLYGNEGYSDQTGRLSGRVVLDTTGSPVNAATVTIVRLGRSTMTDEHGRYEFSGVPPERTMS